MAIRVQNWIVDRSTARDFTVPTFLFLGILNDDLTLTAMMHKYDGLAFWDYATAAPYVKIDMNPSIEQDDLNLCEKAKYIY